MYVEGDIPTSVNTGNNGGFFGGNGWGDLAALIVVAGLFGGFGNGFGGFGGSAGAANNYVLASDFATLQRQLSDGFGGVEKGLDTIRNGLCDGFYTEAQLINGVNTNILQGVNTINSSIADCCCKTQSAIKDVNYNMAMNTSALQNTMCMNTRDIIDNANANYRAIHEELIANKIEAKNDIIAKQQSEINALRLRASQEAQNNYLVNTLRPCPIPAYITCNPFANCGCGNYGTSAI